MNSGSAASSQLALVSQKAEKRFLPGLLLMALFSGYIAWWALAHPERVPAADEHLSFMQKIKRSGSLIPVTLLIVFITSVLITGYATATECAAYGVAGSLGIAAWGRSLTWSNFWEGLMGTTRTSCMIMFILAGAAFLTKTMAFTGIPRELADWVNGLGLSPYALIDELVSVICGRRPSYEKGSPDETPDEFLERIAQGGGG